MILTYLLRNYDDGEIRAILINSEHYISISKQMTSRMHVRFLDSCRFMQSYLDALVKNLDSTQFDLLNEEFGCNPNIDLLKKKGIFPYDYVTDWSVLEEQSLPEKDAFFNMLTDSDITDEEYSHAQNVWHKFNIHNLKEYADLYLKCDVLLLACVFENFRKICLNTYGLDPAYYFTIPGLIFDAMLKVTKVKLDLIRDVNTLNFVESAVRGGLTVSVKRYAESNNPYMENFDKNLPEKYIVYLDANNLYGYAMRQKLPYKDFQFLSPEEVSAFNIEQTDVEGEYGYILEVDIDYPPELHDLHNDFPLLPEHLIVGKQKKLITSFYNKKKYVIHLKNLQQALSLKLKVTKTHRILRFRQSDWLKTYIDLNTSKRMDAKNAFEKDFFKLMNNAMFGKTMESVRKRRNCKIICKYEGKNGVRNLISSPLCKKVTIIGENLVVIELRKPEIKFDKPQYIGAVVLDLSKVLMVYFHYFYAKVNFADIRLLYTDTDSFFYLIVKAPHELDFYQRVKKDSHMFDTSDYPRNNKYNIRQLNKKVIGLFKDEAAGEIITHFCSLRAKMYSYKLASESETKKAKGVTRSCLKKITFDDYVETLFSNRPMYNEMFTIRSKKFDIHTFKMNKKTLSADDDKRIILPNQIDTLAINHKDL